MTKLTAADREAPLTDDVLLQERIRFLLRRANVRQFWMLFLYDDDVQAEVLMPCDDLPADPDVVVQTEDLGRAPYAVVLASRIAHIMSEFGLAQAVFVWERRGDSVARTEERVWARTLAQACRAAGAQVRAQFLLHDRGVRLLTPDDYLGS